MRETANSGHWVCPRCQSTEAFESQEVTGAYAVTYNTPGPIDPTFINQVKSRVVRCNSCGEKTDWVYSEEAKTIMRRRSHTRMIWIGNIGGLIFIAVTVFWAISLSSDSVLWATAVIPAFLSAVFFVVGLNGKLEKRRVRRLEGETHEKLAPKNLVFSCTKCGGALYRIEKELTPGLTPEAAKSTTEVAICTSCNEKMESKPNSAYTRKLRVSCSLIAVVIVIAILFFFSLLFSDALYYFAFAISDFV